MVDWAFRKPMDYLPPLGLVCANPALTVTDTGARPIGLYSPHLAARDYRKYSFPSTTLDWNKLPAAVVTAPCVESL